MPRNIVPKNAMMRKAEIQDAQRTMVFRHGAGTPGGELGGRHVFFVGLRASGKTTLGAEVARRLGRPFVDLDTLIQERAGTSVAAIVAQGGWEAFRRLETEALAEVCARPEPTVVATGGGAVLAEANRELLRRGGPVFFLMATTLLVVERLTRDQDPALRPPLTELPLAGEMGALREERDPLYMQVANFVLRAEEPTSTLAAEVLDRLALVGR
jgi:shikimate kinase